MGVFAGVVFAAQGLQRIVDGDEVARRGALGVAVAAAGLAAILAIAGFFPVYSRVFLHVWDQTSAAGAQRMVALSRLDWLVATLRGALLVVLLATVRTRRRAAWSAAVVIYLAADLGYVTREINPRMPRRFFDPPPVVDGLLRHRRCRGLPPGRRVADRQAAMARRSTRDRRRRLLGSCATASSR